MSLVGKDYRKDEQIQRTLDEARRLDISPYEAKEIIDLHLKKYFPNDIDIFSRLSALEELTDGFFSSGGGMATPLNERYAQKHGLSGRLSPETVFCPPEERNYGSAVKGLKENINEPP